jgi:phosphatidylserine/phosphatidylglycerophosphate/cardiolipin synthase-like enzyme
MTERVLGTTDEEFELERSEEVRATLLALTQQARHSIDIVSRHLDPGLYDNEEFGAALRQLVVNSRRSQVRILLLDSVPVVTLGNRLVELAQRLSSYVSIRVPAPEHKEFNEAWLVADATGFLHRRFSDRFESTANFADRRQAAALTNRFDEIWQRAQAAGNLRRLHL